MESIMKKMTGTHTFILRMKLKKKRGKLSLFTRNRMRKGIALIHTV